MEEYCGARGCANIACVVSFMTLHYTKFFYYLLCLPSFTVADEVIVDSDDDNDMVVVRSAVVVAVINRTQTNNVPHRY